MQLFTSKGLSTLGPPATSGHNPYGSRMRYGASGMQRRNENGLLAVVERHRDAIHCNAASPQPADAARR